MQARCNAINVPGSSLNLLLNLNKIIKSALLWKIIFIWNEDENRSTWISLIWIMISINGDRRDHNNKQNVSSASDGEPEGEWMGEERKKGRQLVYINRSLSLSLWSTPFYTEGLFVLSQHGAGFFQRLCDPMIYIMVLTDRLFGYAVCSLNCCKFRIVKRSAEYHSINKQSYIFSEGDACCRKFVTFPSVGWQAWWSVSANCSINIYVNIPF